MKHSIDQSQYDNLSDQGKQTYIAWTLAKSHESGDYSVSYRFIGHLIQFLDEHITHGWWHIKRDGAKQSWRVESKYMVFPEERNELIDALWEAVKRYLESEQ